jgi:hypothetical protein
MRILELLGGIRERGGDLRLKGDGLEYLGPPLTDDLRATIRKRKPAIVAFLRRLGGALPPAGVVRFGSRSIPALLALLADHGVYCALTPDGPELRAHPDSDPENADQRVVDELNGRIDELVAFLRKPSDQMTDRELADIGFRRNGKGVELLAPDAPEFADGWSPPKEQRDG